MSQEMRKAVEQVFSGQPFKDKVTQVLERELGAVIAPMVAPGFTRALERELAGEFLRGFARLYAGDRIGYVRKKEPSAREQRDRLVCTALDAGEAPALIARRLRIPERTVYRIAKVHRTATAGKTGSAGTTEPGAQP